ncbi:divisome protein SepX/GlpR [Streptacidiphilus neutrinimicus]|uniref:divisome protein SepX/GlpR n=1 Tax=Streptacidiphilus neutrinimicus TaxID=105420 RepID=UPI0005A94916|nr:hypothetical protein [Streptacidiphilus neutrinimicus]
MSSSGLIYAVIVGAWAAYLVPMWLRRQDELNEARPTERFSTAIRLLSGRAAMERRISRQLEETQPLAVSTPLPHSPHGPGAVGQVDGEDTAAEARGYAEPGVAPAAPFSSSPPGTAHQSGSSPAVASRRRAALLARRRRMVVILFAAFTAGMVVAAVGGVALLWIPAVPAVLFSVYIAQMRRQEHRRYEVKLDRRRAAEAAQRVRQQAAVRREGAVAAAAQEARREAAAPRGEAVPSGTADEPGQAGPTTSGTGAMGTGRVESWADDGRPEHAAPAAVPADHGDQGWDPVPVPLPTYVTAPVAPRATLGLDLSAPDTYSSARARQTPPPQQGRKSAAPAPRRPAPKPATPLFDQYAEDAPRAANE